VGYDPGAPGSNEAATGWWWGENIFGAAKRPVTLKDQTKLVYSPHTYGPSVFEQEYFSDVSFPNNMPSIWMTHFASIQLSTKQPLVVGEAGGKFVGKDRHWQEKLVDFLLWRHIGLFYFCLNPDSDDTGGLLQADWQTPESDKLRNLERFVGTKVSDVRYHRRRRHE